MSSLRSLRAGIVIWIAMPAQVLSEFPLPDCIPEIDIRGGYHPDVSLLDFRRTNFDKFTALKHSEQFGLGG